MVRSWLELVEELYRGSWNAEIGRFRSPVVCRGMGDERTGLTTTLGRVAAGYPDIAKMEAHILSFNTVPTQLSKIRARDRVGR